MYLQISYRTVHNAQCTLYSVHCTLYSVHCINIHWLVYTLWSMYINIIIIQYTLYTVYISNCIYCESTFKQYIMYILNTVYYKDDIRIVLFVIEADNDDRCPLFSDDLWPRVALCNPCDLYSSSAAPLSLRIRLPARIRPVRMSDSTVLRNTFHDYAIAGIFESN